MRKCDCPLCKDADYNSEEFYVDINDFDREHKNGVSGLLRVKDEEQTIAASIDSCIDALDELIICYQQCSDRTPEIIEQKRAQYPDKIKVYYYAPHTYNSNLTPEQYKYAVNLPDDSIHLLSNYYNYTQSKATYKYALKIDADQIYFTERLKEICDAYRSDKHYKTTFAERMSWRYFQKYCGGKSISHPSMLIKRMAIALSGKSSIELYNSMLLKIIANKKYYTIMSGINISCKGDEIGIPYLDRRDSKIYCFNGVGDHTIYAVSKNTYYHPFRDFVDEGSSKQNTVLIEALKIDNYPFAILQAPFMWHHLRHYTTKGRDSNFNQIPYNEFRTSSLNRIEQSGRFIIIEHMYRTLCFMYKYDRKHPDFREEKEKYGL